MVESVTTKGGVLDNVVTGAWTSEITRGLEFGDTNAIVFDIMLWGNVNDGKVDISSASG